MEKQRGINIVNVDKTEQCDIHVVSSTFVCEHPKRQRDYYSAVVYKCWVCKKIVVAN